jgi:hypothetical protein
MPRLQFNTKQKLNRFKRLNNKFKREYRDELLDELEELDLYLGGVIKGWVKTYAKM